MKTLVVAFTVAAFLATTFPASAAPTAPAPAPHFITKGTPLTAPQAVALNQQAAIDRISLDAGGGDDFDSGWSRADEAFIGIVVVAAIAGLVYLTVRETQDSKLF